jgi:sugar/nucleoside kinase (ribokinase family)
VNIVCAGLATVDLVQRVSRVPGIDEKVEALAAETATGGPAANAAVTAAALGATVTLVSAVGAHPLAGLIREDLDRYGVTLLDATPAATDPPPVSAIAVLDGTGQRSVVSRNARGVAAPVPPGLDRLVATADAVLVDGHHPALAVAAATAAHAAGRPVVVDAGSWRPVFAEILPLATVVACSAAFRPPGAAGAEPGDVATARVLLAAGVRHVAVTHGPEPVRWWSGGRAGAVPVPPVSAVDTTGAGDVFHGALVVAVATHPQVLDLAAMLAHATGIAAIRVSHAGPRAWLADPRLRARGGPRSPGADGQTLR